MEKVEVKELKGLAKEVKEILELNPKTRDDDWVLLAQYIINKEGAFSAIMLTWDTLSHYNFSSIMRARRKVQELFPELRGEKRKEREARQQIFVEFAEQNRKDLEDFWEDSEEDVGN